MTSNDFNNRYSNWLVSTYYGLSIDDPEVIAYLDGKFKEFVKREDFKYYQIKIKFNSARFYADGLERYELDDVEFNIDKLLKGKLEPKYA